MQKKISRKKIIIQLIAVSLILGTIISLSLSLGDINKIANIFSNVKYKYFFMALGLSLVFLFFSAFSGFLIIKSQKTKIPNQIALYVNNSESFFNGITPFASGAQPIQAYYYMKNGVDGKKTTSALLLNTIVFQMVSMIIATVSIFIFYNQISLRIGSKIWIVWVGYLINFMFMLSMLLVVYVKAFYKLIIALFRLLSKIKPLRKTMNSLIQKTPNFVIEYQTTIKELIKNLKYAIPIVLTKTIAMVSFYSITFYVAKTLDINLLYKDFGYMFATTIIASTMMAWIPLPGASGGTELAFILLMKDVVLTSSTISANQTVSIMLLWRFFSYYFAMLYGFISFLLLLAFNKKELIREKKFLNHTYSRFKRNSSLKIAYFTDFFDEKTFENIKKNIPYKNSIDVYANKNYGNKKINVLSNATIVNYNKVSFIKYFFSHFYAGKISKGKTYDIIFTDSTLFIGSIAKYLSTKTYSPLVYYPKTKLNNKRLINYRNNKNQDVFINFAKLVVYKNIDQYNFISKKTKTSIENYLILNNTKIDINLLDSKLGFTKMYDTYLRGSGLNILVMGADRYLAHDVVYKLNENKNNILCVDNNFKNSYIENTIIYKYKKINAIKISKLIRKNKISLILDFYDKMPNYNLFISYISNRYKDIKYIKSLNYNDIEKINIIDNLFNYYLIIKQSNISGYSSITSNNSVDDNCLIKYYNKDKIDLDDNNLKSYIHIDDLSDTYLEYIKLFSDSKINKQIINIQTNLLYRPLDIINIIYKDNINKPKISIKNKNNIDINIENPIKTNKTLEDILKSNNDFIAE